MTTTRGAIVALASTAMLTGLLLTGCGSDDKDSSSATTSAAPAMTAPAMTAASGTEAATEDYDDLLIQTSDIDNPDGEKFTAGEHIDNPNGAPGITNTFTNAGGTRMIGDTILVLPDAAGAATALAGAVQALPGSVTGGTPAPVEVGTGGTIVSGTSPGGDTAVTAVVFQEGRAFVTMEFTSAPDDPVPPDAAVALATRQAELIKSGLK